MASYSTSDILSFALRGGGAMAASVHYDDAQLSENSKYKGTWNMLEVNLIIHKPQFYVPWYYSQLNSSSSDVRTIKSNLKINREIRLDCVFENMNEKMNRLKIPRLDIIDMYRYEYNRMIKDDIIVRGGWVSNVGKVWCLFQIL